MDIKTDRHRVKITDDYSLSYLNLPKQTGQN